MLTQMCEQTYVSSDLGFVLFPDNGYRECLANGSWAARVNYSECQEILNEEVRSRPGPPSTSQGKGVLTQEQLGPWNFPEAGVRTLPYWSWWGASEYV